MKKIVLILVALGLLASVQPAANAGLVLRPDRGQNTVTVACYANGALLWSQWAVNTAAAQTLVLICEDQYGGVAEVIFL